MVGLRLQQPNPLQDLNGIIAECQAALDERARLLQQPQPPREALDELNNRILGLSQRLNQRFWAVMLAPQNQRIAGDMPVDLVLIGDQVRILADNLLRF